MIDDAVSSINITVGERPEHPSIGTAYLDRDGTIYVYTGSDGWIGSSDSVINASRPVPDLDSPDPNLEAPAGRYVLG